jgi:hypothetical protein
MDKIDADAIKAGIRSIYLEIKPYLNEKTKRLYVSSIARLLGYGGAELASEAAGMSRPAIIRGSKELEENCGRTVCLKGAANAETAGSEGDDDEIEGSDDGQMYEFDISDEDGIYDEACGGDGAGVADSCAGVSQGEAKSASNPLLQMRKKGGGPKSAAAPVDSQKRREYRKRACERRTQGFIQIYPCHFEGEFGLQPAIQQEITRRLGACGQGRPIHLHQQAYPGMHRQRLASHIRRRKEKEGIGNCKAAGRECRKEKNPLLAEDHDFPENGKASPHGVYGIAKNVGFVNLGISSDTAEFAVESIRRWHGAMAGLYYPNTPKLLAAADGGGSNGSRGRLWKAEPQNLANELGIETSVRHFPPGTSKWNKIERRLFSFTAKNWRGAPLLSVEIMKGLIERASTATGLTVQCLLGKNECRTGRMIPDADIEKIGIFQIRIPWRM